MNRLPALGGSLRSIANAYDEDDVSDEELELSKAKKRKLSTEQEEGEKSEAKTEDSDYDIVVSDEEGNSSGAGSAKNSVVVSQPRVAKDENCSKNCKRKHPALYFSPASRLVSYGGDEDEEDSTTKTKESEVPQVAKEESTSSEAPLQQDGGEPAETNTGEPSTSKENQAMLDIPRLQNQQEENERKGMMPKELLDHLTAVEAIHVTVPVEPEGRCSNSLQEKIENLLENKLRTGSDLKLTIQRKKNFRNPSIYEKLIAFCGINEIGTNYPSEIYDPFSWEEDSFYERLSKIQKEHHERKQRERSKVEFVSATRRNATNAGASTSAGASSSTATADDASRRRKSKWDVTSAGTAVQTIPQSALQGIASVQAAVAAASSKLLSGQKP